MERTQAHTNSWMCIDKEKGAMEPKQVARCMLCSLYLLHETPSLQLPCPHPRLTYKLESLQLSRLPGLNTECHLAITSSEEGKFCQVTKEAVGISSIFFFRAKEEAPFQSKSFPVRISSALGLSISVYLMPSGLGLSDR